MSKQNRFEKDSYIVLVDPIQDWSTWKTCAHSLIEPLGLEIIGAVLNNAGYKVKIIQAQGKKLEDVAAVIGEFRPQIVGVTSYTYNFNDALNLAKIIKDQNKDIITVFGGYHSTFVPEIVKDEAVDFIIKGPGEVTTLELVKTLEKGGDLRTVRSIAFLDQKGDVINTSQKELLFNLDKIPFALRDEEILKGCSINSLMYPPPSQQKHTAAIYASRGCPYSCSYCASPAFYNHTVKFRSPSNVVLEIEKLHKEYDVNILFFTDLTFNLNRNYVIELCEEIIKKKVEVYWYALFRPEGVDRELAKVLKKAGCSKVAVGIESCDINTLYKVRRGRTNYFYNLKETCNNLHREGILTRGLLIIGYPWETHETYTALEKSLSSILLDEIRVGILTPFPGTQIYYQFKKLNKILGEDLDLYDSRHVIIKHDNLKSEEILKYAEIVFTKHNMEAKGCA